MNVLILCKSNNEITTCLIKELNRKEIPFVIGYQEESKHLLFGCQTYKVKSKEDIESIFSNYPIDNVIHLMNTAISTNSIKESFHESEENMEWTTTILEACVKANVKKIIFPSTISVYGDQDKEQITEETTLNPILFEGLSKKMEERYIQNYHVLYGLTYSILRFSCLFGDHFSWKEQDFLLSSYQQENKFVSSQNGEKEMNFIHVRDAVKAMILSLDHADNEIINICSQETITRNEIVQFVEAYKKIGSIELPIRDCGSRVSIRKAKELMNWVPTVSFRNQLINRLKNYQVENA